MLALNCILKDHFSIEFAFKYRVLKELHHKMAATKLEANVRPKGMERKLKRTCDWTTGWLRHDLAFGLLRAALLYLWTTSKKWWGYA